MEKVDVRDAIGMALCHDMTKIVPGEFKGSAFKRGHIIREDDVEELLRMGKENIYVWNLENGYVHEDEAANRIAKAVTGRGISLTKPSEGKVELIAEEYGLLKINTELLYAINSIEGIALATVHENQYIKPGKKLAGTRVIPLVIESEIMEKIETLCVREKEPLIQILPLKEWSAGLIVTGSEVYKGRIEDQFGPVVTRKMEELGSNILRKTYVPDSIEMAVKEIKSFISEGANMIILTGGMSVDPDDLTPASIRAAGGRTVTYGVPVLPGAMFMLAYIQNIPVIGLPGCVMYHKASIFDLVMPRIMAGENITREELIKLSYGGFCLRCEECSYPDCSFGK